MKRYVLIVAGGIGTRMQSSVPKQFLEIDGSPIICLTIEKFLKAAVQKIVVVIPKAHESLWLRVAKKFLSEAESKVTYVFGGSTRSDSVRAGLGAINTTGLVAIHDAVRPHVSIEVIEAAFESAKVNGSGVAVVPLKDSIREVEGGTNYARDRSNFVIVQTPQTFRVAEIKEAYKKLDGTETDDATVYEMAGFEVTTIQGSYSNIKITTPEDLK